MSNPIPLSQAQQLQLKLRRLREEVSAIQDFWRTLFPEFDPLEPRQCHVWINAYDFNHICSALEIAQARASQRMDQWQLFELEGGDPNTKPPMTRLDVIKYASGTMKNKKNEVAQ